MRLALYQPDIPQNTGTILRLAACLSIPVDIIGPAGFDMSDRNLRRAGLDYLDHVDLTRHLSWERFHAAHIQAGLYRLVLLSSKAAVRLPDFVFSECDTLILGRESAGVPEQVRAACDAAVAVPDATATAVAQHCRCRRAGAGRGPAPNRRVPAGLMARRFSQDPAGDQYRRGNGTHKPCQSGQRQQSRSVGGQRRNGQDRNAKCAGNRDPQNNPDNACELGHSRLQ